MNIPLNILISFRIDWFDFLAVRGTLKESFAAPHLKGISLVVNLIYSPTLASVHARKTMTDVDSTLKSSDITLPTKVCIVKAMVFPVVMYGCESWTIKLSTE